MSHDVFSAEIDSAAVDAGALARALGDWCVRQGVPRHAARSLQLMLDELLTNIAEHGFASGTSGLIVVRARRLGQTVELHLRDSGGAFDPLTAQPPDLSADIESRPVGGLGIHFVRKLADRIAYQRKGGWNELDILKRWT